MLNDSTKKKSQFLNKENLSRKKKNTIPAAVEKQTFDWGGDKKINTIQLSFQSEIKINSIVFIK